jgi:hypothetical protein
MGAGTKYGTRRDGTAKGEGYFGLLSRPDGGVSTEISVSTDALGGREFPLLVPTLTPEEVTTLLSIPMDDPDFFQKLPPQILMKAQAFAEQRAKYGAGPFADRQETRRRTGK